MRVQVEYDEFLRLWRSKLDDRFVWLAAFLSTLALGISHGMMVPPFTRTLDTITHLRLTMTHPLTHTSGECLGRARSFYKVLRLISRGSDCSV